MSNIATVQTIYGAFGRGDADAILDCMADDVEWEPDTTDYHVPWLRPGRGKPHVAAFFAAVASQLQIERFEPLNMLEGGDQVAAVIRVGGSAKGTGASVAGVEVHLWTFGSDGKVTALRHYVDTHAHVLAAGGG